MVNPVPNVRVRNPIRLLCSVKGAEIRYAAAIIIFCCWAISAFTASFCKVISSKERLSFFGVEGKVSIMYQRISFSFKKRRDKKRTAGLTISCFLNINNMTISNK